MPRRKVTSRQTAMVTRPQMRKLQRGAGIFSNIGRALSSAFRFVKRHKLLSKGLSLVPHPYAQGASKVAGAVGMGRRRKTRGRGLKLAGSGLTPTGGGKSRGRKKVIFP